MKRLAALLCILPGLAWADPALFVARAPGITAYLLGSVHALKPGTEWQTAAIGRAFDEASECWFEIVIPKDAAAQAMSLVLRGLDPQKRLPGLLGDADHARLEKEAASANVPGGVGLLDTMQPWLAFMMVQAAEMKAAGLDGETGVDQIMQHQAQNAGKAVVGFETLDQQIGFIADQPEPVILHLLHEMLTSKQPLKLELDKLLRAWLAGDVAAVGRMMNETERSLGPGFADVLLLRRNKAWAERLDGLRDSGKTILVTVGAGHLAGPGNLRDELVKRHFTVERVQP